MRLVPPRAPRTRPRGRPRGRPPRTQTTNNQSSVAASTQTSLTEDSTSDREKRRSPTNQQSISASTKSNAPVSMCYLWTSQLRLHQQDSGKTRHKRYGPGREVGRKHRILAIQSRNQLPPVKRSFSQRNEPTRELTRQRYHQLRQSWQTWRKRKRMRCQCLRFKEWTKDEEGLEFVLGIVVPPLPPNIVFGKATNEWEHIITFVASQQI